jgi:hypothetical protein
MYPRRDIKNRLSSTSSEVHSRRIKSNSKTVSKSLGTGGCQNKDSIRRHITGQRLQLRVSDPRTNTAKPKSQTHFHRPPTNQTCTHPFPALNNCPMRWQDSRRGKIRSKIHRSVIHHSNFPFRHEPSNRTPPFTSRSPLRAKLPEALNSIPHVPARPCIFAFRQSGAPIPWGFNQTTASEWSSLPAGW